MAPIMLDTKHVKFEILGGNITVYPLVNGTLNRNTFTKWMLNLFTERAKVTKDIHNTTIPPVHVSPSSPLFNLTAPPVDPLELPREGVACSTKPNLPCGALLRNISASELNCWAERVNDTFYGAPRQSAYVHFTHPQFSNFSLTASHHIIDRDLELNLNNSGEPITHIYKKDALKLTYDFRNWPWAEKENVSIYTLPNGERVSNGSVMEFWSSIGSTYSSYDFPLNLTAFRDTSIFSFNLSAVEFPMTLLVDIPGEYLIDGVGYKDSFTPTRFSFSNIPSLRRTSVVKTAIHFPDAGHWSNMDYDPNIGALFGEVSSNPPAAPPSNSNIGKSPKWVPIVVVLVIVAALIVTAILIVAFVPAAKNLVQPFSKRKHANSSGHFSSSNGQPYRQWESSKTPPPMGEH